MKDLTLKEVESLTGLSDSTLRRYIRKGKLPHSFKDNVYYIREEEAQKLIKKGTRRVAQETDIVALPEGQEYKEILILVNEGFKSIADSNRSMGERAVTSYQETVAPIIEQVLSLTSEDKTFLGEFTNMVQMLQNNVVVLLKIGKYKELTPEEGMTILLEGFPLVMSPEAQREAMQVGFKLAQEDMNRKREALEASSSVE